MSLTVKHSQNTWFSKHKIIKIVMLLLTLAVLIWLYVKILAPRIKTRDVSEKNLPALKIVIKNGCGVENLATDFANTLKDKNIDVVSLGDTPHPIYNVSLIEVKKDDKQDLQRLQKMTGIQRFTLALDSGYEAPFIVILGRDFEDFMKN